MSENRPVISNADIEQYELLVPLLRSAYNEIKELSKKKPDGLLNKFKVDKINKVLIPLKKLTESEPIHTFLDLLDSESLPSNSDAILVLSEYIEAMRLFSDKYKHDVSEGFDMGMNLSFSSEWNRNDE